MQSLELLTSVVGRFPPVKRVGRVRKISRDSVSVSGLSDVASVGHLVCFGSPGRAFGEVASIGVDEVQILVEGALRDLRVGQPVSHLGEHLLFPDDTWLGRIIDGNGKPLDEQPLANGSDGRQLDTGPPPSVERRALGQRLSTGYALFNTLLPLVRGQRVGVFSGSGVGKSSLMGAFARDVEADVVVIALIGERGREVNHFIERALGKKGLARSVVVAATSDQSALSRRRAAFTAMAVAEHFRDQGKHVLLMLDSITRLAEAHREIACAAGESTSLRGYPPSMIGLLAGYAERAGPGGDNQGDITAVFTVLVSGSDMEEPVADTLRGLLDGHIVLSRDIAERGRFPAVDVLQSVSRALPEAASENENALIFEARRVLSMYEDSEIMVRSGLYQPGSNPQLDRAVTLFPSLDAFACARDGDIISSFERLRTCLSLRAETSDSETKE